MLGLLGSGHAQSLIAAIAVTKPRRAALDLRQPPDPGRRQLQAVAGGIAEIERTAAARPRDLLLDRDARLLETRLPTVEVGLGDREADVARTLCAVGRDVASGARGAWLEQQQHAVPAPEEHEQAVLLAVQ